MKLKTSYVCLLLIFLSLGIYYPSIFDPFNSVDDQLMVNQLLNQEHFSLRRHFAPGGTYDYFRPLVTLTFEIDKYVGGLQEAFMHLVNILLHSLNVLLIFLLAQRFSRVVGHEGNLLPLLSATLFCIHPLNTEAVNWIAGRADMLAGTFVFISIIFTLKALDKRKVIWGFFAAITLFCGTLCKETALFLIPGIFFLLLLQPGVSSELWRKRWILLLFCILVIGAYFALRWGAFKTDRGVVHTAKLVSQLATTAQPVTVVLSKTNHVPSISFWEGMKTILKVSGFYSSKLFQPLPLNFAITKIDGYFLAPGIALPFVLTILMIRRRPVGTLFVMSACLGSAALLVVFTRLAWTPIAERYMYIPCGLFSIAVVFGIADLVERMRWQRAVPLVVSLLFVFFAWATVGRNIIWQDNLTLFQDTVSKSPDFDRAKNELAVALSANGRNAEADAILAQIKKPSNQLSSLNSTIRLMQDKKYDDARKALLERLKSPGALENDILELLVKTTGDMAVQETSEAKKRILFTQMVGWIERMENITHNPFHWYQLGRVHLFMKNRAEAQRCFAEAAKRLPESSVYHAPAAKLAKDLAR